MSTSLRGLASKISSAPLPRFVGGQVAGKLEPGNCPWQWSEATHGRPVQGAWQSSILNLAPLTYYLRWLVPSRLNQLNGWECWSEKVVLRSGQEPTFVSSVTLPGEQVREKIHIKNFILIWIDISDCSWLHRGRTWSSLYGEPQTLFKT